MFLTLTIRFCDVDEQEKGSPNWFMTRAGQLTSIDLIYFDHNRSKKK